MRRENKVKIGTKLCRLIVTWSFLCEAAAGQWKSRKWSAILLLISPTRVLSPVSNLARRWQDESEVLWTFHRLVSHYRVCAWLRQNFLHDFCERWEKHVSPNSTQSFLFRSFKRHRTCSSAFDFLGNFLNSGGCSAVLRWLEDDRRNRESEIRKVFIEQFSLTSLLTEKFSELDIHASLLLRFHWTWDGLFVLRWWRRDDGHSSLHRGFLHILCLRRSSAEESIRRGGDGSRLAKPNLFLRFRWVSFVRKFC